ncbi:MAG TPA: CHAT domain-containing protein [Archangium sp.]|uniref:CHAT domain-containing protein n=1 Tax=Archangium sp. TaxID=1872627 RepID=UPI002E3231BA|nr:CHAT domain-containing protein [Archangium sp.]HEX5745997.1 CHAT domain-containing protein [Archangium sp.]
MISVKAAEAGWTVEIEGLEARRIRRSPQGFPLPPEQEVADEREGGVRCLQASPEEIREVYARIVGRSPADGDMDAFGRYLFDTLLGEAHWNQLVARAGDGALELLLRWEADAWSLAGLPWEMMRGPEGFLAAHRDPRVSFVRLAPTGAEGPRAPSAIPFRVLFVININSQQPRSPTGGRHLKPGAEYLAVLSELRRVVEVTLNSRILLDATPEMLERAVEEFQPTIVHFICHGEWKGLHLRSDGTSEGSRYAGVERCDARRLIDIFRKKSQQLPSIVLLNACDSSGMPISSRAPEPRPPELPLAVQLAQLGIPMVIGMAGRIADHACRLFSLHFYGAFLREFEQESEQEKAVWLDASRAVAEGRRAALVHFEGYSSRSDWCFPHLVVREDSPPVVEISDAAKLYQLQQKVRTLKTNNPFCDRLGARRKFEQWLDSGAWRKTLFAILGPVESDSLVIHKKDQFGLTSLLEEFAVLALYSGFLPCVPTIKRIKRARAANKDAVFLRKQREAEEPPASIWGLAQELSQSILDVRAEFDLESKEPLEFDLLQARREDPLAPLHPEVERRLRTARKVSDPRVVRAALAEDLARLSQDAMKPKENKDEMVFKGVMVFLDEIHQFGPDISDLRTLLTSYGLGSAKFPVPVVFTTHRAARSGLSDESLKKLYERLNVESHKLGPFSEDQGLVPYEQFLLFKKLVFKPEIDAEMANFALDQMHLKVMGIPSRLYSDEVEAVVRTAVNRKLLEPADDERIWMAEREEGRS